ncbi:TonB-dependent receptor [Sphingobium sp. 15-1]|nr:TonB-dependent receptor [Sphingobium sp. 15-1]
MSSAALAQSASEGANNSGQLQDIIVTAQKYQQSVNSVPMTITVATGEQLQLAGIKAVEDLPRITPGLNVVQTPTGVSVYTLRGVGFNDSSLSTRPAVTVYVDEAPIPFAAMTRGAGLDADHVEVLKGPQGTLFGANSTGGAINYVAAKPTDRFEAGATATYGRFDQFDASGYISGPITDTLSVRLALEHQGSGDWQKSISRPNDTAGQQNFNNGRLSLLWKPTDRLRVLLTAQRWIDRSDAAVAQAYMFKPQEASLAALTGIADYPYAHRGNRWADWDPGRDLAKNNRMTMLTSRIDFDVTDAVTLTSVTSYSDFKTHVASEADGVPTENTAFITNSKDRTFTQELRAVAQLERLRLTVGANYQHDKPSESTIEELPTASPIIGLSLGFGDGTDLRELEVKALSKAKSYAAFGNVEFELTPQFTVQGGLRYTRSKIAYRGCLAVSADGSAGPAYTNLDNYLRSLFGYDPLTQPLGAGDCTTLDASTSPPTLLPGYVTTPYDEDNLSWRAGVQFKPSDDAMLYASISKGYKMGGHPFVNAAFSGALTPARQESVLAYEAGFKAGLLDRKVQLNGAVFYGDYKDKQEVGTIIDPVLGPLGGLTNIPKARVYGAELQIQAAPFRGLTIDAAAGYTRTDVLGHYTDTNDLGNVVDFHKTDLANAPRWQLNGTARYQWALNERIDMFVSGSLTYRSSSQTVLGEISATEVQAAYPGFLGEISGEKVDGYTLVDLSAGVESPNGKWRAYIWGRNVFNTTYQLTNRFGIDTAMDYMGKPATYGVTVGFKY